MRVADTVSLLAKRDAAQTVAHHLLHDTICKSYAVLVPEGRFDMFGLTARTTLKGF